MNPILLAATMPLFPIESRWPTITSNTVVQEATEGVRLGAVSTYAFSGGPTEFFQIYEWIVSQVVGIPRNRGRWLFQNGSYLFAPGASLGSGEGEGGLFETETPFNQYILAPILSRHGFRFEETPFDFRGPLVFPYPGNDLAGTRTNLFLGFKLFEDGDPTRSRFGWLELRRDGAASTNQFRIEQLVADFVPNRPIRVGQEPEKPKVASRVDGDFLELSWDAAYADAGFFLEFTPSLEPPVLWERVDDPAEPNRVRLPLAAAEAGYFRLTLP